MATVSENIKMWGQIHQWETSGEEWSQTWGGSDMQFYGCIFPRIRNYLPASNTLEIATGQGRWTQYLLRHSNNFIGVDLVDACAEYCKERFSKYANSRFYSNDGSDLSFIEDGTIDFAFSFDSLVHADSSVIKRYLIQLKQKLSANGVAFIHHSNFGVFSEDVSNDHWRDTTMTYKLVQEFCVEIGLSLISQELITWGSKHLNDCLSVVTQYGSVHEKELKVYENINFMNEANYLRELASIYRK